MNQTPTPRAASNDKTADPVEASAPEAPSGCAPAVAGYSDEQALALIAADYEKLDPGAKSQTLYVSLHHLAEQRSVCDMQFFRFGIGQLMNMTSWGEEIVAPVFIDASEYVARVDVRDLKWTPESIAYLLAISPRTDYGVIPTAPGAATVVRADWLAAHLTRPSVYGYIMRNPETERLMELQAGVDNTKPGRFGGVYKSGVTLHPRILERRESIYGACWISHDFYYRTQAMLVMESGQLPQDDLRFGMQQYIAREYICSLPNGMHSYQITGFISQRRWDGNTCVAQNPRRKDKLVLNGQCFNCHANGLIAFQDKVRGDNDNPSDYIKQHYPEQDELDQLFEQDQALYQAAVAQIPHYDESYTNPLNRMISIYAQRANDDLVEPSAGTFGAFLPRGASGGPFYEEVVNPLGTLAVELGILTPAKVFLQDLPELVFPAFEQKYREAGLDENVGCGISLGGEQGLPVEDAGVAPI